MPDSNSKVVHLTDLQLAALRALNMLCSEYGGKAFSAVDLRGKLCQLHPQLQFRKANLTPPLLALFRRGLAEFSFKRRISSFDCTESSDHYFYYITPAGINYLRKLEETKED